MIGVNKRIELLISKLFNKQISPEEEAELSNWYNQNQDEPIQIPEEFELSEEQLRSRIFNTIKTNIGEKPTVKLWPRIAVASAVAIMILGAGLFYFNTKTDTPQTATTNTNHDIAPGKIGATLTLASGKQIRLSDANNGELAKESGVTITKSANGQLIYKIKDHTNTESANSEYNTLTTTKSETYQVKLPDGSMVWLNAASRLVYPANFASQKERKIQLEGEAYFEVAKDKMHPFIVESQNQQVKVLGTHFNINAYQDEKTSRTTLLEGSVSVSENDITTLIKPGFEAVNNSGNITINKADTEWAVAWKNNKFIFDSQNIEDIMRMISRWYNVEVIYSDQIPTDTFWGSVSRFNNISKVLTALESTGNVHFKIEGRKVYVSR